MKYILATTAIIVLLTVSSGLFLIYNNTDTSKKKIKKALGMNLFAFVPIMVMAFILMAPSASMAAGGAESVNGLGLLAAALSTGMATIGTGYAVGVVGSAAIGAVSEDPKILGRTLLFVGFAEGIAIYGLVISILIIGQL